MNSFLQVSLCAVLAVVAVLSSSVEAAPRKKRQILSAILGNVLGEGYGTMLYISHFEKVTLI
jgi:hypothetical protein